MGPASLLVWLLLWCPIGRSSAAPRKKKDEDADKKVAIPHHSFSVPLQYEEVLDDWTVSGASLVERERLLLHPSVPERGAFMWNKAPLLTNDFEAIVHFRAVGPKGMEKIVSDQSFAVWYVQENISAGYNETALIKAASWKAGLQEAGMTLSGFKSKFDGVGAILSMTDSQSMFPKSVISGIWNAGDRDVVYGKDVPTSSAKAMDFRNTMNAAQFKLRVTPTSVEGHFKQSPSLSWNECFKIDRSADPVKAGGYIGITAWSGSASADAVSDMLSVFNFEVSNFDTTVIGEEMKDVSADIQEAYRNMLTDENRHFVDQKSQAEHLTRLTRMLSQHAESSRPADEKMYQDLETLEGRMSKLDTDCKTMVKELQVLVGPGGKSTGVDIKDGIIGLRRLLVKDSMSHKDKIEDVKKKVEQVRQKHVDASKPELFNEVVKKTALLQDTVNATGSQSTWLWVAIIVSVVVIGMPMYSRMHYYERKHFL